MTEALCGPHFTWDKLNQVHECISQFDRQDHWEMYRTWQEGALTRSHVYSRDRLIDQFAHGLRVMIRNRGGKVSDFDIDKGLPTSNVHDVDTASKVTSPQIVVVNGVSDRRTEDSRVA